MERKQIADQNAEEVVGGSIIFTPDHTMCGLNCNNQCRVLDYGAMIAFITANYKTMREAEMMRQMLALGYMTRI